MLRADRRPPLFGINIDPDPTNIAGTFDLARYADNHGVDLISVQDHPYNGGFLETWTLLSTLGANTSKVRLFPNVANLPLRPPALLAKSAATLDILTGGRVELGLGAGAFWDAVEGYGGPRRSGGEAVDALEEAMQVMHLIWRRDGATPRATFEGRFYQLTNAQTGPPPPHLIGIWLGALKPRMLRLTGRLADGWSVSHNWSPPRELPAMHALIDQAAEEAGRQPSAIMRNYNVMGVIQSGGQPAVRSGSRGMLIGGAGWWAETIAQLYIEFKMDAFNFWPVAGDAADQIRRWTEEVAPLVRERIGFYPPKTRSRQ